MKINFYTDVEETKNGLCPTMFSKFIGTFDHTIFGETIELKGKKYILCSIHANGIGEAFLVKETA